MDGSPSKVKKARSTAGCPSSRKGDGAVNACEVMLCRSFNSMPCRGEQTAWMLSMAAVGLGAIVGEGEGVSTGVCVGRVVSVGGTRVTGAAVFTISAGDEVVTQADTMDTITRQMHPTANLFQKNLVLGEIVCVRISLKRCIFDVKPAQGTILRASI